MGASEFNCHMVKTFFFVFLLCSSPFGFFTPHVLLVFLLLLSPLPFFFFFIHPPPPPFILLSPPLLFFFWVPNPHFCFVFLLLSFLTFVFFPFYFVPISLFPFFFFLPFFFLPLFSLVNIFPLFLLLFFPYFSTPFLPFFPPPLVLIANSCLSLHAFLGNRKYSVTRKGGYVTCFWKAINKGFPKKMP